MSNKECEGYFKIKPGTGLRGTDLPCVCPYCGHKGSQDTFFTKEQIEYGKSVALKKIDGAIRADLKKLEFNIKPKGLLGIGISMQLLEGRPIPIFHYREKKLETNIVCKTCSLDYSVYGLFAFCPDCGIHNSLEILQNNLDLVRKQISLSATIEDNDLKRYLIEGALENCVSSFDGFGRESCHVRASLSSDPAQVQRISFQNLKKVATRLKTLFNVDLQACVNQADWENSHIYIMKRHLLVHRSGVIDQQYLDETNDTTSILGRRIVIQPNEVIKLTNIIENLGRGLLTILPRIT